MKRIPILLPAAMLWLGAALATTPNLVHYQGSLTDGSGNSVVDSTYSLTFSIYAAGSGGTALWSEVQSVSTKAGVFSVLLGTVTPMSPDLFDDSARYLATNIGGTELSPRSRLASAPYGFVARRIRGDIESDENALAIGGSTPADTAVLLDTSGIHLLGSALYSDSGLASLLHEVTAAAATKGITIKDGRYTSRSQDGAGIIMEGSGTQYKFDQASSHKDIQITPGDIVVFDLVNADTVLKINVQGVAMHSASGTDASYSASGVQLTGPGLKRLVADASSLSIENPVGTPLVQLDGSSGAAGGRVLLGGGGGGTVHLSGDSVSVSSGGGGGGKIFVNSPSNSLVVDASSIRFHSGSDSARISESIGDLRIHSKNYTIEPAKVDFPNLKLSITDAGLGEWHSWMEKFVIGDAGTFLCSSRVELQAQLSADFDRNGTANLSTSIAPVVFTFSPDTRVVCRGPSTFSLPVMIESDLTVTGGLTVFGPKAFAHDHPTDPNLQIIYVALEGNEVGTYTRGSAQLLNGKAEIQLPEDFAMVTGTGRLTAQITPRGPVQGMLYVESVSTTRLVVRASNPADQDSHFDYLVNGIRKGFEAHRVIQERKVAMRP